MKQLRNSVEAKPDGVRKGVHFVTVEADEAGQRIDNFLITRCKGVPKSLIYRVLRKGEVRVNKGRIKPEYRLSAGDSVRIPPMRVAESQSVVAPNWAIQAISEAVLYEDSGLIVLNKPAGMAVHGGSGLSFGLIEVLRQQRSDERHLELVHRLDLDTSGCLLVSKKRSVLRALHEDLRAKKIEKNYLALAFGRWPSWRREVDAPLEKNTLKSGERMVRVSAEGKPSQTAFSIEQRFDCATLVKAQPITGRTHQIRVHAQHAGHPLLGDKKYSNPASETLAKEVGLKRLFLHASSLSFFSPAAKKRITVTAPLADELNQVLSGL